MPMAYTEGNSSASCLQHEDAQAELQPAPRGRGGRGGGPGSRGGRGDRGGRGGGRGRGRGGARTTVEMAAADAEAMTAPPRRRRAPKPPKKAPAKDPFGPRITSDNDEEETDPNEFVIDKVRCLYRPAAYCPYRLVPLLTTVAQPGSTGVFKTPSFAHLLPKLPRHAVV